jgi:hypothetical protein
MHMRTRLQVHQAVVRRRAARREAVDEVLQRHVSVVRRAHLQPALQLQQPLA